MIMFYLYLSDDVKELLHGKKVVLFGDSIVRGLYKDLLTLYLDNQLLHEQDLKTKGEKSFRGDELVDGGAMHNGINYREARRFTDGRRLQLSFHFITRCYNEYVRNTLNKLFAKRGGKKADVPDILIISSCLWDVSRYGPNSSREYVGHLEKLCRHLQQVVPSSTLVIFMTAMPLASDCFGGFLASSTVCQEFEIMRSEMRANITQANVVAAEVMYRFGFDTLDMGYFNLEMLHHRVRDGIHWDAFVNRRMANILLTHISIALRKPRPTAAAEVERRFFNEGEPPSSRANQTSGKRPGQAENEPPASTVHGATKEALTCVTIDPPNRKRKADELKAPPPRKALLTLDTNKMRSVVQKVPPKQLNGIHNRNHKGTCR